MNYRKNISKNLFSNKIDYAEQNENVNKNIKDNK